MHCRTPFPARSNCGAEVAPRIGLLSRLGFFVALFATAGALAAAPEAGAVQNTGEIRLLVRADDMGACHAGNVGCIKAYREGLVRSVEVIVPGPWFLEAAAMLEDNPGLDVGVHLALTSEWDLLKWRPLTAAPSLVDADGYFFPNVGEPGKPGSGLFGAPRPEEIERELRAQIELARRHIKNLTHLSTHMFHPRVVPEIQAIIARLSREYDLPVELEGLAWLGDLGEWPKTTFAQKETAMAAHLEQATPGVWFFLDHPGMDDPEMRAMHVTPWYPNVAADRDGVTRLFTSPKLAEIVARRAIKLVSYGDIIRERRAAAK